MLTTEREELAWAAGFFDGEGNVCCTSNGPRNRLKVAVQVNQTHKEVLTRFQNVVGVGAVYGPRPRKQANCNDVYQFHCSSFENVQQVIVRLWPWLSSVKRKQAHDAMQRVLVWFNRTECYDGHDLTGDNAFIVRNGGKRCRKCQARVGASRCP